MIDSWYFTIQGCSLSYSSRSSTIGVLFPPIDAGRVALKEELEVPFEDIETIGGYVILAKELPKPEEAEEEVEAQKVEVEKEE